MKICPECKLVYDKEELIGRSLVKSNFCIVDGVELEDLAEYETNQEAVQAIENAEAEK